MFLLLQLPYCVSVLLLTSGCKSVAAQYKRRYLSPPQSMDTNTYKLNPNTGRQYMETHTQDIYKDLNTGHQYVQIDIHKHLQDLNTGQQYMYK